MTHRPLLAVLGLCSLLCLAAAPAPAARGIDCAKAGTAVEKLICADAALRRADLDLVFALRDAEQVPGQDKAGLLASQRVWLKERDACPDAACLQAAYAKRQAAVLAPVTAQLHRDAAERRRLRARLGWPEECETTFRELAGEDGRGLLLLGTGVTAYPLGGGRTLYGVQCALAAYQTSFVLLLQEKPDGPGTLLNVPQYDNDAGKISRPAGSELAGLPTFDDKTKELTVFTKARGLGDCGSLVRYAFPAAGGVTVVEARTKACTDPPRDIAPEKWPLVKNP